jgi:hypothetical protein
MSRTYNISDPTIWKKRWGKARDAAFKMYDNKWTLEETSIATGVSETSIRQAAYRQQIPLVGKPGRPAYGSVKQAVLAALVGRETANQLQVRTGFRPSSIRSACKYMKIKLIKEGQS